MLGRIKTFWHDEAGLTTVEYALLLALVAVVAVTGWTVIGQRVSSTVTGTTSFLPAS